MEAILQIHSQLLVTQYKATWLTAISSHGLVALPAKIPEFNHCRCR